MAQRTRNEITQDVNTNIYDNNNKEITAAMFRTVLGNFRDSKFNLKDDELKTLNYEVVNNVAVSLQEKLESLVGALPLWGSTKWFDPGSDDGDIEDYIEYGIVENISYARSGDHDCELIIQVEEGALENRYLSVSVHYQSTNYNNNNDLGTPIVWRYNSSSLKVSLREFESHSQKIRFEILAFKV